MDRDISVYGNQRATDRSILDLSNSLIFLQDWLSGGWDVKVRVQNLDEISRIWTSQSDAA
jgi:hypothetical protein